MFYSRLIKGLNFILLFYIKVLAEMAQHSSDSEALLDDSSDQEDAIKPAKEEWYYPPSGGRQRYHHCELCPYKTTKPRYLRVHQEKGCRIPEQLLYGCSFCGFRASSSQSIRLHKGYHTIKLPYQCQLCTYSALTPTRVTLHINRDHPKDSVTPRHWTVVKSHLFQLFFQVF